MRAVSGGLPAVGRLIFSLLSFCRAVLRLGGKRQAKNRMRDRNPARGFLMGPFLLSRAVLRLSGKQQAKTVRGGEPHAVRYVQNQNRQFFTFFNFFVYIWHPETLLVYVSRRDTY
ncbi:hypothetical protein EFN35_07110 [Pediococcus parvulus]|nr:hypothetical protein [Pediococcus parvulus]